jgi:hypothetical protein
MKYRIKPNKEIIKADKNEHTNYKKLPDDINEKKDNIQKLAHSKD